MQRIRPKQTTVTVVVTLVITVALGGIVYLVSSALPFLAAAPTVDPNFGALNQCVLSQISGARLGFAVAPDGKRVAGFSDQRLAICGPGGSWSQQLVGITRAVFDSENTLWAARSGNSEQPDQLWRISAAHVFAEPLLVRASALTGTHAGVVVLEGSRLVSLARDGSVLATRDLPGTPVGAQLSTSADGNRVSLLAANAFAIFEVSTLEVTRSERPCDVDFLWWRAKGHRAIVSCAGVSPWALEVDDGLVETAKAVDRTHSQLASNCGIYVRECEQLPCTGAEP